jgi:hypothetical protein
MSKTSMGSPMTTPPGTYFRTVHSGLIHDGHKNRVGIYEEEGQARALFLDDVQGERWSPKKSRRGMSRRAQCRGAKPETHEDPGIET